MENFIIELHKNFFFGVAVLFLFQSVILFIKSNTNTVRLTMAILELFWGIIYLITFLSMSFVSEGYSLLREKPLIIGNFYIALMFFFPMQIFLPGWLNIKRGFLLILPIIVMTILFYGGMSLLDETPEDLYSFSELWSSIDHFNVWFRFVMLISNFLYIAIMLKWLYKYEQKYIRWKNDNFADQEYVDIAWMRNYDYIMFGISVFFLGVLFLGGRLAPLCHSLFCIFSFSYIFYKTLFYESPYPEDFFKNIHDESNEDKPSVSYANEGVLNSTTTIYDLDDASFESRIPSYMEDFKQWMDKEKPYLYHDFKLSDVSRIMPLNRSYLSRVFNEGFGRNFSEVVRIYRISYSKELLENDPTISMHKVAILSGFNSDSTYIRAFKQVTGLTPTQYKLQNLNN